MRSNERGVTLIELLIAVTLVALLSTGMLMAIRLGLSSMEKINARLYGNRRVMSVNRIIDSQIAGMVQTKADCIASGNSGGSISFFQGEPQTMRFVSTYSLDDAARGYPKILELQVIPGEQGEGVRLIVNEQIYAGPASTGRFCVGLKPGSPAPLFIPVEIGPRSFVLADKLASCRIIYREALPDPPFERWVPVWTSPVLPSAIRIEMAPLPSDRLRLPLVTVTAPVRVTKDPRVNYDAQ
jgi:prepilin-type N-terminal cleavage/methylation domain-containing protein